MGNETTFAGLIAAPASEKVFLVEVKPAEVVTGWALTDGEVNAYEVDYLNETVTIADGSTEPIRKAVVACEVDGVAMTAVGTTGLAADLLDEDFSAIDDWTDADSETGVSAIDPAGQLKLDSGDGSAEGSPYARVTRSIASSPDEFTIEVKTYFDALGSVGDNDHFRIMYGTSTWVFRVDFSSTGLWIYKTGAGATEVGTNIVKYNASAAWQTWRFQVDKSGGEAAATVEVFLDGVSQGTFDCDYEVAYTGGLFVFQQYGYTTDNMVSHVDCIKIATGLGVIVGGYEEVESTPGSYWHDTTNGKLYVHTDDGGDPGDHTVIVYFWVYFATKGIVLDGRYYEPYIGQNGIQQLTQEIQPIYYGAARISSGDVSLLNGRGFFDQIAVKWIWNRKDIRILLGGDALPYSEYTALFTGIVMKTRFTQNSFTIEIQSSAARFFQKQAPLSDFLAANYPNLDPAAEGRPIPLYYGHFPVGSDIIATCINTAYAANTYQFKICDTTYHAIQSIIQVYIDYGAGAGWETIAHANEDLNTATFTITDASFVVGTTRVKVAFYGYWSGGVRIEGAPEIVEDLLLTVCGYTAADLNAASFTASKTASAVVLMVPVEEKTSILSIIQRICQSDFAFIDEDGEGLIRYRTWEPTASGTAPVLAKEEIMERPEVMVDSSMIYTTVRIGYGYINRLDYIVQTDEDAQRKYGVDETLTLDTYIKTEADATTLAERILWFTANPLAVVTLKLKATVIDKLLGDKIALTLARAPFGTVGGYSAREFEIISKTISCFPLFVTLRAWDAGDFAGW